MKVVTQTKSLSAVGPYSLAIEKRGILFLSGQIGIDQDLKLAKGGIEAEFKKIMENTKDLLAELGYTLKDIVNTRIYLSDLDDYSKINKLYAQYFKEPYPTRSTLQVAGIPLGASIEIEFLAMK